MYINNNNNMRKKCSGVLYDKDTGVKRCCRYVKDDENYCNCHIYLNDFTDEQIKTIKDGNMKSCSRCHKWFDNSDTKRCNACNDKNRKGIRKRLASKKCLWLDRNMKPCHGNKINGTDHCKFHQYVIEYTDEMKRNSKMCSGCKKVKYMGGNSTCDVCRSRSGKNRKNREINKDNVINCKKCNCKAQENGFCIKHQKYSKIENIEDDKKMCSNFYRGCTNLLGINSSFLRCEQCREKEREYRMKRRNNVVIIEDIDDDIKVCTKCYGKMSMDHFIGVDGRIKKTCDKCRAQNKKQDDKRKGRKRIDTRDPVVRQNWKDENRASINEYYMNYRQREIEKIGLVEYRKKNALIMQKYRAEHKDELKKYTNIYNQKPKTKLKNYKYDAMIDGKIWGLTDEQALDLINGDCFYCGICISKDNTNGIDRLVNSRDYTEENCVSSCMMCNYMKCCLDPYIFIDRCEHILTYHNIIDGEMDYSLFPNEGWNKRYSSCKTSAKKRGKEFKLTKIEYESLTFLKCYICGKPTTLRHRNNIDRYDNSIGYILDNCKSCCGECNYMKSTYNYSEFIDKLKKIYDNSIVSDKIYTEKYMEYNKNYGDYNDRSIIKSNRIKMSKEEIQKRNIKKNKIRDKNILYRYSEEYIKQHAQELARLRKLKLQNKDVDNIIKTEIKQNNKLVEIIEDDKCKGKSPIVKLTEEEKREKNRLKQQRYRDRKRGGSPRKKLTDEEKREKNRLRQQRYRAKDRKENPPKVKFTIEEKREKNRLRQQQYRVKDRKENPPRVKFTIEEKREKNRLRQQRYRAKNKK